MKTKIIIRVSDEILKSNNDLKNILEEEIQAEFQPDEIVFDNELDGKSEFISNPPDPDDEIISNDVNKLIYKLLQKLGKI